MSHIRYTTAFLVAAAVSLTAQAQTAAEHDKHHPATTVAQAQTPAQPAMPKAAMPMAGASASMPSMAAMDERMKAMQAMHEKMVNAKSPEERSALMAEHMKTMQDGMAMMNQMGGMGGMGAMGGMGGMQAGKGGGMQGSKAMPGTMAQRQQMLEKRMDMMQSMMQMMMDRMPVAPAK